MKRATLVTGLLVFMVPQFSLAQNQLFVGTWNVDVAKSKYQPGPGPKREILRFEPVGEGFRLSLDGVNEQGPYHSEATGNVVSEDGKTMRGVSTVTTRGQINQIVIYEKQ